MKSKAMREQSGPALQGSPLERAVLIAAVKQYVLWQFSGSTLGHENALTNVLNEASLSRSSIEYDAVLQRLRQFR
jgi:hypothetical protein